jgi:hypothetical protein
MARACSAGATGGPDWLGTNRGGSHVGDLLPGLVPLAVGGSLAPPLILLTFLFLGSRRPLPNTVFLALGYLVTCAAVGVSALILFGNAGSAAAVGSIVSVVVGGTLIILGRRSLLDAPDPDTPLPSWMESTRSVSPPRAFGLGVALFPIQIKNLAILVACLNLIVGRGSTVGAACLRSGSC